MVVRTRCEFPQSASSVWPLLCRSQMDPSTAPWLRLGVPLPLECRLPDGHGGVGAERECRSDQGVVHQRILAWTPETGLAFRMEHTELYFRRFVDEMAERFDLVPSATGVTVTRTTTVVIRGRLAFVKRGLLFVGLKRVHRYVFRNWQRLAARSSAS